MDENEDYDPSEVSGFAPAELTDREAAKLGARPIDSMRDLAARHFPDITLLYADLGDDKISGLSFVNASRGPTIILNLHGKNRNPWVRRYSLAHELCHLLFDWNRQGYGGLKPEDPTRVSPRCNPSPGGGGSGSRRGQPRSGDRP